MNITPDIERKIIDYVFFSGKHITYDIDSKNPEEYCIILKNIPYIWEFLLKNSYIRREYKKCRVFCHEHLFGVELIIKDEYMNSDDYCNELIYVRVLRDTENIQYLLEHFDEIFRLSYENPEFIYIYFQRHRNTRFQFPSENFVYDLLGNVGEGTDELHIFLKNGIRSLRHYVETQVLIFGLAYQFSFLHKPYYCSDEQKITIVKESLSNSSHTYEIIHPNDTIILGKNKGFYYILLEKEIYIEDNSYVHEDYSQIGNQDYEEEQFQEHI
jgi:hypothetical protein